MMNKSLRSAHALRTAAAWALPTLVVAVALLLGPVLTPAIRLVSTTVVLYLALKAAAVLTESTSLAGGGPRARMLFWTAWPGFDARPFARPQDERADSDRDRLGEVHGLAAQGATLLFLGLSLLGGLAVLADSISDAVLGWLGIAALLLTVHFGYADVLTALTRRAGYPVRRLFDDPLTSRSLGEFWGRRWNVAFVEMDRVLFLPMMRRRLGRRAATFGVFAVSGALHELAISFPAGAGWGGPLLYFAVQGALTVAEGGVLRVSSWPAAVARAWTVVAVVAPLPFLFHAPFRDQLVVPLVRNLGELAPAPEAAFGVLLWIAAIGNVSLLVVSYQVPRRLGWHDDTAHLQPFNAKLLWTFGGFIILTYLAFGVMTFALHDELLAGDRAAVAIAAFAGLYWLGRLAVDLVVFDDGDWPQGPLLVVGHVLLNGLFALMSSTYLALWAWHLLS